MFGCILLVVAWNVIWNKIYLDDTVTGVRVAMGQFAYNCVGCRFDTH